MGKYSQDGRAFRVDTPLGKDELLLEGFSGHEAVSEPFSFNLELLSENDSVAASDLLGQAVTISLRLADGSDRAFHGLVRTFRQLGTDEGLTNYEANVVPWLWFLSLAQDCRVFQQKSVLDIVEEIFGKYPDADYEIKVVGSYAPREYCVQYRESDLAFVTRLLEAEGIFYYFEHTDSGHKLTLTDDLSMISPCPVQASFELSPAPAGWLEEDVITELYREHAVLSEKVTLRDYDYLKPSNNLETAQGSSSVAEVYDYPGGYAELSEGERYATVSLQRRRATHEIVRGAGSGRTLTTGHTFDISGYYVDEVNQTYFVLGTWHSASGGGYRSGESEATYANQFECIPATVPYRPPLTAPKPMVRGSQTAVVVGPGGEEIYTDPDGHGRVKIQFHWDRLGASDENSSCWVRVSQAWAGKGWGALAIPRIGQEVIVDFLEGDPDRPIITGRVYNQDLMPPYELPANNTQAGIMSRSSKGGGGANFNEIRLEDKKGSEQLYIHAEKDKMVVVENDRDETVGHDETVGIGNDQSLDVGNDRTIKVGKNHDESVGTGMSLSVGENRSMTIGKNLTERVGQNMDLSVDKDRSTSIGNDLTIEVSKDTKVTVGGKQFVSIAKESSHSAKKVQITAKDEISLVTGKASIVMKKNGDIVIKGKKITVKGSGDIVMKGSKIAQN